MFQSRLLTRGRNLDTWCLIDSVRIEVNEKKNDRIQQKFKKKEKKTIAMECQINCIMTKERKKKKIADHNTSDCRVNFFFHEELLIKFRVSTDSREKIP